MKSKVDKLDVVGLLTVPVDLNKLSEAVKNDDIKKSKYNELVKKANNPCTTDTRNLENNWLQNRK